MYDFKARGFETKEDYIRDLAEEMGVPFEDAMMLAELLGDTELYDGLVSSLEDIGGFY